MATEDFSLTLANWAQWYPAWGNASISGGALTFGGGADVGVRFTGTLASGPAQDSAADIAGATWINQYVAVGVRMTGVNATRSGYFARLFDSAALNKTLELIKYVNGTPTVLATTTYATGSAFRLRIEDVPSGGNAVLKVFVGATQITALNFTDSSSPLTGGEPGGIGNGGTLSLDNWEGDNYTPSGDTTPPTLTSASATGGTLTGTGNVTSNEAGTLYWRVNGSATPLTYPSTGAMSGWTSRALTVGANSWSLGSLTAGTYFLHLVADDAAAPTRTAADLVTSSFVVSAGGTAPTITVQPANQSVVAPATATFSVTATGSGLTYQWRRNGSNIGGAVSSSYTTPATSVSGGSANNGDLYSVVVTGDTAPAAISSNATLTVTSGGVGGTITVPEFKQWTGALAASFTVPFVYVKRISDGASVLNLTAQSVDAGGNMLISNVALSAGVPYMVFGFNADGTLSFKKKVTAT